jgi:hypothetical protein
LSEVIRLLAVLLAVQKDRPPAGFTRHETGQRRIDVLELLRVLEALGADPVEIFREILRKTRASSRPYKR